MQEFLSIHYEWIRALHIISVIAWMAGMLYLPRLFVYHAESPPASDKSETFKVMERRLLRFIMNPAMISTWLFGLTMLYANPALLGNGWIHVKLLLVLVMSGLHGYFAATVRRFAHDHNVHSALFFRWLNEAPTVLMIAVVFLAVLEPF